ncbi:flavodoxin [Paraprevotella xylaniphila YIT 11841]|uniref:Flavodoxin n=1 Tax=Paraprevotella xylaniphila YIT 11841 TaxID=762982 RepID=F3QWQ1_9BACT|nr:flavodoxin [Paraprevotella xylaniphila]EGG51956.1 flavodoxin [Paraprevotella xylaniphila YIT 11841]
MYKFLLVLLSVVGMATATFAQQKQDMNNRQSNNKILVAYFSATGTTADAAKKLTKATGGELYVITPVKPYTSEDLDWNDKQSRSSVEMNDPKARPAIKSKKENISDYDVIFIGYPIWWDLAPRIINTFIESHNLKGKTVIPFSTSGGSSITNSVTTLKHTYPDLNWQTGKLLNRMSENAIHEWIDKLEFLK